MLALAPSAAARPAPLRKLDSSLRRALALHHGHAKPRTAAVAPIPAHVSSSGRVLVDVYVNGAMRPAAAVLRDEGMRVAAISGRSPERVVDGWRPVVRLDDVAARPRTRAVVAVQEAVYNTGSVTSEGDAAHNA